MTDGDDVLARRAAAGDHQAFGALIHRHGTGLAQAARGFGIPETDVDDIVQETFVAAWRSLEAFDPTRSFRAWIFHIGLNKMRDLRRARRVRQFLFGAVNVDDPDAPIEIVDASPGPDRQIDGRRALARVQAVLDGLDTGSREAIVLTAIVGLSHAEAGIALGMTVKAVEGRIARARAKLATLIDDAWP